MPQNGDADRWRDLDNRREFLRKVGTALGGVVFAGGGGAELLRGQAPLPNGYKFYRVLSPGKPLSGSDNPVKSIGAAVMIGAYETPKSPQPSDVVYFHGTAIKQGEAQALFRAQVSYDPNGVPTVPICYIVTFQGDKLANVSGVPTDELPIVIGTLGIGSANSSATYVTTISVADYGNETPDGSVQTKSAPGAYQYDPFSSEWKKVARLGDDSPDGGIYGGFFGDVQINEDGTVLLAAATTAEPTPPPEAPELQAALRRRRVPWYIGSDSLMQINPSNPSASFVVLKTGNLLPGTAAAIESFGLINAIDGDYFVAQVKARRLDALGVRPGTAVVRGRLRPAAAGGTSNLQLLTGSPRLFANGIPGTLDTLTGESIIGPRIGYGGLAAVVTHDSVNVPAAGPFDLQRFSTWGRRGRELILRAGDTNVNNATALGAPVVSSQDQIYYVAQPLDDGTTQLLVSNGSETKVILKSGDMIDNLMVTEILHGYHPAQVDYKGRLAFAIEQAYPGSDTSNPANVITSVVIGIPV